MNEVKRRYPDLPTACSFRNFPEVRALLKRRRETQKLRQMYKDIVYAEMKKRQSSENVMYRSKSAIDGFDSKPFKLADKRRINSANLQTSIGRCTDRRPKTPKYDALTRGCLKVPGLLDKPQKEGTRRPLRVWEDEVTKIVEPRPQYTVPVAAFTGTSAQVKLSPWIQAPEVHYYVPDSSFHNCRDLTVKRDFIISKEFISERRDAKKAMKILGNGVSIKTCL